MNITTVGLDLAKSVFHVVALDAHGHEKMKKRLSRAQVLKFFANLPACVVGMEACASNVGWVRPKAVTHQLVAQRLINQFPLRSA